MTLFNVESPVWVLYLRKRFAAQRSSNIYEFKAPKFSKLTTVQTVENS